MALTKTDRAAVPSERRVFGLDAIRAAAIFMVVVSHFGIMFTDWFGAVCNQFVALGGFFGVELFFVLSGFLVGRLLIGVIDDGATLRAWVVFMTRRWLRTLPLYFLWLALLSAVWRPYWWLPGYSPLLRDLPYFITLTQNLAWPMVDNWFGVSWSLSVEEWFYIIFSVLLLAGVARFGRGWFWVTTLVFLCTSPILRLALPLDVNWDEVTSKVVIYRLDAIGWGAVLAWVSLRRPAWLVWRKTMFLVGAILIVLVWSQAFDRLMADAPQLRRTFIFDVVSIGFALMLPAAAASRSAWRPVEIVTRKISSQSYAIYMMHLSLAEIVGYEHKQWHVAPWVAVAATCLLTWSLSAASYRWFEQPLLSLRPAQYRAAI